MVPWWRMRKRALSQVTWGIPITGAWKDSHGACFSPMLNMHPKKISQPRRTLHPIVLKNKSKEDVKLGRGHKTQGAGQTAPLLSADICGQSTGFYLKTFDTLKIFVSNNNHNMKTPKHQILSHRKQGQAILGTQVCRVAGRGRVARGSSVRQPHWRVWKKSNVSLMNVRSGTFCQRGRESRKGGGKGKKKRQSRLPTHHPPSSGRDVVAKLPFDGAVGSFPCHYAVSKLHLMLTHGR